ncbi:hypothetical protein BH23THE1_BH23THE1_11760 [soil metagenome]
MYTAPDNIHSIVKTYKRNFVFMDLDQLMEQWTQVYLENASENTIIKIQKERKRKIETNRLVAGHSFLQF